MSDELFLYEDKGGEELSLLDFSIQEIIAILGGKRKAPQAFAPHIAERKRTPEQEEQLRLLRLLNQANDAKSLKRWQEAENEAARAKHNRLVVARLQRETAEKKARNMPDVKKANKEIAERERNEEAERQLRISAERLRNLEKARAAKRKH